MREEQAVSQKRQVEVTTVFDQNVRATEATVVNIGGSRSSKSYSIAQLMVKKFNEEKNKNFLTARKTLPSLRMTAYKVTINMMKDYGCYSYFTHNKSARTIYNPYKNNLWIFTSVDDPEKIKSTEYNYMHMEEANEFNYDDYMIMKLRMSGKEGPGERNQMYLSLNPSEKYGWVNEILLLQKDVKVIHSTYKDATQFLPPSYVERLERLEGEDSSYWQIYGLGLFADIKGIVHRLHIVPELPEAQEVIYGLDYGFTNPSTLIEVGINMEKMELYLREVIYQAGLTNRQLINRMKDEISGEHRQREIYADAAEPARIEEAHYAGLNIHAADKGKKSVESGIDCVNRFELFSTSKSVNLNREMMRYKRKVDRTGHVLEGPVKFDDHCPNAVRYAVYTHLWERMVDTVPGWVWHRGMQKDEDKAEKEAKSEQREKGDAVKADVDVEVETPKGEDRVDIKDEDKKREEPRRESDDDSWVI